MKKLVQVQEVEGEGLEGLLGEQVLLFAMNYIYTGTLSGVNDKFVKLDNARIVYETGPFNENNFKDAQILPHAQYVMLTSIESFGKTNKKL